MTGGLPPDRKTESAGAREHDVRLVRQRQAGATDGALRALVVADEAVLRRSLAKALITRGHQVLTAEDGEIALTLMNTSPVDVVLADLSMRRMKGVELLEAVRGTAPDTQLVVMGAHAEMPAAADALDAGAYEFVVKPFVSYEAVVHVVERANERKRLLDRVRQLSRVQQQDQPVDELLGSSPAWRKARAAAMRAASTAAPILLIGEPGCGKEMLARMVHAHSQRRGSFVVLHCDVLAADATERELFGVVDGTSGGDDRGLVHAAEGGTLMLASVDALGARAQVRLMRLLQSGEPARGERLARAVDVRVIASCERDLKPLVESGSFRGDLFHQLAVIVLWLPALRRRRDDIPLLACHFLAHYARRLGKNVKRISPEALRVLREASWPGNVCELRNVVQRAVTTCCGEVLMPSDLVMEHALEQASGQSLEPAPLELPAAILDLPFSQAKQEATTRFERWYLTDLLQRTAGNLPEAARQSGLDRSSFRRLRRRCGEDPGE